MFSIFICWRNETEKQNDLWLPTCFIYTRVNIEKKIPTAAKTFDNVG